MDMGNHGVSTKAVQTMPNGSLLKLRQEDRAPQPLPVEMSRLVADGYSYYFENVEEVFTVALLLFDIKSE